MSCQIITNPDDGKPVKMILAHKISLDPTFKQIAYFKRACGTARFTWNWALAKWNEIYEKGGTPNGRELKKLFNATKYAEFPRLENIHRDAHSQPFTDLQNAFVRFFKKTAEKPKFKKKGRSRDSFYVANDQMRADGRHIRLPVIGRVRLREPLRFQGKIMSVTVSRTADRWFVSIQVETAATKARAANGFLGVDLGSRNAAMLSTGEALQAPKPLRRLLLRLQRLCRSLSKKARFSKNWYKAKDRLARLHARIANIRADFIHKLTTRLTRENQAICIEDLNVTGMMANRNLARTVSDIGLYEIRRQLTYKSKIYGDTLVIADRWFPSSKTCSRCGEVKEKLGLDEETFHCECCDLVIDRDYNAALNLLDYLLHALGLRVSACGGESTGLNRIGSGETGPYEAGTRARSRAQARKQAVY